jgi:hypothetical protein
MSLNQSESIASLVRQLLDLHACALEKKKQNNTNDCNTSVFTVQQQPGSLAAHCSTAPTQLGAKQPWVPSGVSLNSGVSRGERHRVKTTSVTLQHDQHEGSSTHPVTSPFHAPDAPDASCKQQRTKSRSPPRGLRQTNPYGITIENETTRDRSSPVRTRSPHRDVSTAGKLGSPRRRQHSPTTRRQAIGTGHGCGSNCAGPCFRMKYSEALQMAYGPPAQSAHTAPQLSKAYTASHEHSSMPVRSLPDHNCSLSTKTKSSKEHTNRRVTQQTSSASSNPAPSNAAASAAVAVVVAAATAAAFMSHSTPAASAQPAGQPALSSAHRSPQQAMKGFTSGYIDGRLAALRSSRPSSAGSMAGFQPESVLAAQHTTSSTARSSLCDVLHLDCPGQGAAQAIAGSSTSHSPDRAMSSVAQSLLAMPASSAARAGASAAIEASNSIQENRVSQQSGLPATVSAQSL